MHRIILAASACALLTGCVGSSTYGTGTTQEAQLVSDLASVVSFKRKKKAKIDYSERAKLVKPTTTAELPAPIELNAASSAFPVSPENQARNAAKPQISRPGDDNLSAEDRKFMNWTGPNNKAYRAWTAKRVAKMKARKAVGASGDGKRVYLTEPPQPYRKAYESAPVGDIGKTEQSKEFRKKSKGNIFSKLLRRG